MVVIEIDGYTVLEKSLDFLVAVYVWKMARHPLNVRYRI